MAAAGLFLVHRVGIFGTGSRLFVFLGRFVGFLLGNFLLRSEDGHDDLLGIRQHGYVAGQLQIADKQVLADPEEEISASMDSGMSFGRH